MPSRQTMRSILLALYLTVLVFALGATALFVLKLIYWGPKVTSCLFVLLWGLLSLLIHIGIDPNSAWQNSPKVKVLYSREGDPDGSE